MELGTCSVPAFKSRSHSKNPMSQIWKLELSQRFPNWHHYLLHYRYLYTMENVERPLQVPDQTLEVCLQPQIVE